MELLPALANASGWAAAVFTLLFVIRALMRGDLIAGSTHRQTIKREEFWRDRALVGTSLAERATSVAETKPDAE